MTHATDADGPIPPFADLPGGRTVDHFGYADGLGALNWLTPERVLAASKLVRTGQVVGLNAPLTWPDPPLYGRRRVEHVILRTKGGGFDDRLDGFFTQCSTQWDGFRHVVDPITDGHYNPHLDPHPGVEAWAGGIVGRGVLLDPEWQRAQSGRPLTWQRRDVITVDDLERCAEAQGVEIRVGDILLIRTGWQTGYQGASPEIQEALGGTYPANPGIEPSRDMAAWLWERGIAAAASDSPTLEAWPREGEPLLHYDLVRLGIPIGELWWLDELAGLCRASGRWEFLLTSAPLNLIGGAGTPANALAIL
jgi:kynurenine formamidase